MDLFCKVMSLLFNMLSKLVITFPPRSKHLLISWLQSPSAMILEPRKIKSLIISVSPSISYHEVMGPDAMILVFWMLSLKPTFSLCFFTFIKRLFSSSSLSSIRVVSSAYPREHPKFFIAATDLLHLPREVKMLGQWTDWLWENGETHIPNPFLRPITFFVPIAPWYMTKVFLLLPALLNVCWATKAQAFQGQLPVQFGSGHLGRNTLTCLSELLLKSVTPGLYILWSELNDI